MARIERLSMRLTGLSAEDAREACSRLAKRLGASFPAPSRTMHVGRLYLRIEARCGESSNDLVDRIAAEILRSLERSI
jgi:hypothetical protein